MKPRSRVRSPRSSHNSSQRPFVSRYDVLHRTFRSVPMPYLVLRADPPQFTILDATDAYLDVTHTTRSRIVGRPLFEAFPDNPGNPEASGERNLRASLQHVLQHQEAHAMAVQRYDLRSKDGSYEPRFWSPLNTPVIDANGMVVRIIHCVEDVTEMVRLSGLDDVIVRERDARRQAEAARAVAEHANRTKSEFIAKMSHELRTPLNAIGGYAQLLEMGIRGSLNDDQLQYVTRIRRSEEHLLSLIDDILDLARVEAGRMEFEITAVDVNDTLQRVDEMATPQLGERGLHWQMQLHEEPVVVSADEEKLVRVLLNFVSNAAKNTPPGGTVRMWCEVDEAGTVTFNVSDTGSGIPSEHLERIFQPFTQVPDSPSRSEGCGLGLTISRELARGMGGDLAVQSAVGHGSTFSVKLQRRIQ